MKKFQDFQFNVKIKIKEADLSVIYLMKTSFIDRINQKLLADL